MSSSQRDVLRADLIMVGCIAVSAAVFLLTQIALRELAPITFIAWRFLIATAFLALLMPFELLRIDRGTMMAGSVLGLFLAVDVCLLALGLRYIPSGQAAFIASTAVVLTPAAAWLCFREPITKQTLIGVSMAAVGLGFLTYKPGFGVGSGDLFLLAAAVSFALYIAFSARYAQKHPIMRLGFVQLATVTLIAALTAVAFEEVRIPKTSPTWQAVLFLGIVATAIRFTLQTYAQRLVSATHIGLLYALEPVLAAIYGWIWASEVMNANEILGCAAIIMGIIVSRLGLPRALKAEGQQEH
jgi:drug/metabolite transporter (DMT)-like permease